MATTVNTLEHHWMPFTSNRDFKSNPRLFSKAEGTYYWTHRGDKVLDGVSGLFCVPAGHGRREIVEAVSRQLAECDYAPSFQFGHMPAFEFARQVAELCPDGIDHVFFTCSGSESVDTALKISLAYHRARFQGQRIRFVGRERGYHGMNFGGVSVGGMTRNREAFGPGLPGVVHMRHTWSPDARFTKGQPEKGAELADDLKRAVDLCGAETIAACIVEPIAGSTGALIPPKGYLQRLREICDKHDILLIFDEVITGFGRTGKPFAAHSFGVTPDIMTMAKALTNGNIPMGAVAVHDDVYETIMRAAPEHAVEFFHGYTYSANPAGCAAGLAALEIYRKEALFESAAKLAVRLEEVMHALKGIPVVTDVRNYGLLAGVDIAPHGKPGERGYDVMKKLYEAGLLVKITGDAAIVAPPFIMKESEIEQIGSVMRKVLSAY